MVALWNISVEESLKFYNTFYKTLKEGQDQAAGPPGRPKGDKGQRNLTPIAGLA